MQKEVGNIGREWKEKQAQKTMLCLQKKSPKKPTSASLSFHLFKAYAGLKNYELNFLIKKENLGKIGAGWK